MRAAVTGAAGFIGRALVARLMAQGWEVVAVDLAPALARTPPGAGRVPADVRRRETLAPAFRGASVVFHTAALFDLAASWPELYAANVQGVRNVCAAAQACGVERIVCWGSSSVYGMTDEPIPIPETTPVHPERLNLYARSKLLGEREALEPAAGGPDVIVVRPADVYGPGATKGLAQALFAFKAGAMNAVAGPGTAIHSHVHVDDMTRAAIHLAERGEAGNIYNVADGGTIATADVYRTARERLGGFSLRDLRFTLPDRPRIHGRPLFYVPGAVLRLYARWEHLRARRGWLVRRFGPRPLADEAGVEFLLKHHVIDASKLFATGFTPEWPDVRRGILATLDAYERSGWAAFLEGAGPGGARARPRSRRSRRARLEEAVPHHPDDEVGGRIPP